MFYVHTEKIYSAITGCQLHPVDSVVEFLYFLADFCPVIPFVVDLKKVLKSATITVNLNISLFSSITFDSQILHSVCFVHI